LAHEHGSRERSPEPDVNWVDYVNVLLAVWLAAAPWFLEYVLSSVRREDLGAAALLLIIATCGIVLRTREQVVAAARWDAAHGLSWRHG
jgi:hypothetical protein